jgi:hypothetical protein
MAALRMVRRSPAMAPEFARMAGEMHQTVKTHGHQW